MPDIIITYKDRPALDGFTVRIPAGRYTRNELLDLISFEYQWQCDEAETKTIVIKARP